ncbi:hypothetical protein SRO_7013 [Streptomyces rochei]|nr:hypothetical protein SRO_7013 [Streptomyces rochei]
MGPLAAGGGLPLTVAGEADSGAGPLREAETVAADRRLERDVRFRGSLGAVRGR